MTGHRVDPLLAVVTLVSVGVACNPYNIEVGSNQTGGGQSSRTHIGGAAGSLPVVAGDAGVGTIGVVAAGVACPDDSGLPDAAALTNVTGTVVGGNVRVTFAPYDQAQDYRVYTLPGANDVAGSTMNGATYRCAGNYEIPPVSNEDAPFALPSEALRTRIDSSVGGYLRTSADAQLGFVYPGPGSGGVAVYAVGDPGADADNDAYFQRYPESRVKRYTTSEAERESLLAASWRDDGIVFYAPSDGTPGTEVVSRIDPYYMVPGPELTFRAGDAGAPTAVFSVFPTQQPGTVPVMRVYYDLVLGRGHDELVAGLTRFNKAYSQGTQPFTQLHWSGLTQQTTLVVEALDALCPFQGVLSPTPIDAGLNDGISYPAYLTPDELRATSDAESST